jgi:hypothetical protein
MTDDEQEMLDRISDRMAGSPPGKSLNTATCLSSPFCKNILIFRRPKSVLYPPLSRPTEGLSMEMGEGLFIRIIRCLDELTGRGVLRVSRTESRSSKRALWLYL